MSGRAQSEWRRLRRGAPRLPLALFAASLAGAALAASGPASASGPCEPPVTNEVACENSKPGDPPSDWQINGIGDPTIQGFATSMSVNAGQTIDFKIKTPASAYHIDILRLGYYGGDGARLIASDLEPTAKLPQTQPECLTDSSTGLIDCGNWDVSASWTVPEAAVSGLYVAHLVRDDTGGESQILFVVRDDASHSDIVLKTSDTTWQAYNAYGGNSLYSCTVACPPGEPEGYKAAYAVSYNRPFDGTLTTNNGMSDPFYAEYQLIRFLERNGYDLTYMSQHDLDTNGPLLQNHDVLISSGHDEYWSASERQSAEAARDAGVSLAFFSGNEMFWKTRWEASSDGANTPYRTLVAYKDTHFPEPVDPQGPSVTTSTWRDPRFSPPGDAGRPENSLTGQYFLVNSGTSDIQVPGRFAKLRFWRNTPVSELSPSQVLTLSPGTGTLGYEWDVNPDNGFRPAGRIPLSSTTVTGVEAFTDYGTRVAGQSTATHSLSLYRTPSGALVFGAGTVQWSWGLDVTNAWNQGATNPNATEPDPTMQQTTVNLLADMGAQPATLQPGLVAASQSTDTSPPSATVSSPADGAKLSDGETATISGTATDSGGGVVAAVEVSTDGGATWHTASGTSSWTYEWAVHGSPSTTIKARAVDDSANIGSPSAATTVTVSCPCSIFGGEIPPVTDSGDNGSLELGFKFRSEVAGTVDGIRFYKAAANTGTHIGSLWRSDGTLLAEATFTGETATGWQEVEFSNPIPIEPETTYVAGYFAPNGHYSTTEWALNRPPATGDHDLDSPPLHVLPDTGNGNGLYQYSSSSVFPTSTFHSENYWVDVLFRPSGPVELPGQVTGVSATAGAGRATVTWTAPTSGGPPTGYRITPYVEGQPQAAVNVSAPATEKTIAGLAPGVTYTFTVTAINAAGAGPESSPSNAVTPSASEEPFTIFGLATPGTVDSGDGGSVELGVKFRSDTVGVVEGIRFYKSAANTGTHVGALWTANGALIAQVAFSDETASGWQEARFASPIPIEPETTYVASYFAPNGHYSVNGPSLTTGVDNPPLHALAGSAGGNGVFAYGSSPSFPSQTFQASNYWVDVLFAPTAPPDLPGQVTGVTATPRVGSATVSWSAPASGGPPSRYVITPYRGGVAQAPTTVFGPATSATVGSLTNGTAYTFTVTAANVTGSGPESNPSPPVVPRATLFEQRTPETPDVADLSSVVLGVKFTSEVAGDVTGIRFYKSEANTGVHVVGLWSGLGTLLAQATATGESASGWQQVTFANPVPIAADTTYVATYLAPNGHYSATNHGFDRATDNPPLHAPASETSPNGVYAYSSVNAFPTNTYNATNYWVDVALIPDE